MADQQSNSLTDSRDRGNKNAVVYPKIGTDGYFDHTTCGDSSHLGTPNASCQSSGRSRRFSGPGRHLLAAVDYRVIMSRRFTQWREVVGLQLAI